MCTLISLFRPGLVHSGSASWGDWLSVPWWFECELVSLEVPSLCLDSSVVSPLWLCWVKGVCMFRCMFRWNQPPALLAEWLRSFTCHCSNTGLERTPKKSLHSKLTVEKKILPLLLPGFELATFRSRVQHSTNKLSQLSDDNEAARLSVLSLQVSQKSNFTYTCTEIHVMLNRFKSKSIGKVFVYVDVCKLLELEEVLVAFNCMLQAEPDGPPCPRMYRVTGCNFLCCNVLPCRQESWIKSCLKLRQKKTRNCITTTNN